MLTTLLNLRCLVLTAVLSFLLGTSTARTQTVKPVQQSPTTPAVKGQSYTFTLENFQILDTRARHKDTDHVSVALKVADKVYPAKVKDMGDLNNGTYKVNLSFGPISIPTPDTKVVMTYLVMNSGHDKDKVSAWLKKGAEQLLDKEATATGEFGAVLKYVGNLGIGVLFANCDGWVAGDHITMTGKALTGWGEQHRETRDYHGVTSARGCGGNSHYKVTWSVALQK